MVLLANIVPIDTKQVDYTTEYIHTVWDGWLDGGCWSSQHQTGHTATTVLTPRAVGATSESAVLRRSVLGTWNLNSFGFVVLWWLPAWNGWHSLADQFIDVILYHFLALLGEKKQILWNENKMNFFLVTVIQK